MAKRGSVVWTRGAENDVFMAAVLGRVEDVTTALDAGFPPSAKLGNSGLTLLHLCFGRNAEVMLGVTQRLLASGWDPNASGVDGITPVHEACLSGNLHAVQQLIAAGGKLDILDNSAETPLFYALSFYALYNCWDPITRCQLLQWLADCPEVNWCHQNTHGRTAVEAGMLGTLDELNDIQKRCLVIGAAAEQAQRERTARWSPLRAAFTGTVAVAAAATTCTLQV
jgi:hypothetical protein